MSKRNLITLAAILICCIACAGTITAQASGGFRCVNGKTVIKNTEFKISGNFALLTRPRGSSFWKKIVSAGKPKRNFVNGVSCATSNGKIVYFAKGYYDYNFNEGLFKVYRINANGRGKRLLKTIRNKAVDEVKVKGRVLYLTTRKGKYDYGTVKCYI